MSADADSCPACGGALRPTGMTCPGCGATVVCRLRIEGSPFRIRPLARRVAVGHGLGPDAVTSDERGVMLSGTPAAVAAMATIAEAAGHSIRRLTPMARRRRSRALPALAAAVVLAGIGAAVIALQPAPTPRVDGGLPVAIVTAAPATGDGPAPHAVADAALDARLADGGIFVRSAGPAIEPGIVRDAVRSTVRIVAGRRLGAGVIVSAEGHILTNAHVVGLEETVRVTLHDGAALSGRVVAHRRAEDLAVVRIEPPDGDPLRPISLGAAAELAVADRIFLVGSPGGHDFSVTRGFVAHTHRWLANKPCVQIDAPIDRGSSGGPLVDAGGRLVGINTFKSTRAEGVGYAQMIERAIQGPDAILAPFLYERAMSPAFEAIMAEQRPGKVERVTEDDARDALRADVLAETGVIQIFRTRLIRTRRKPSKCPAHVTWPHRGYCHVDVIIQVVAVTAKGERPRTRSVDLRVLIGRRFSQKGIAAADRGWRSHKPTDPEGRQILDAIGGELGVEVSVWSSTFEFDGYRVADLVQYSPIHPPRVGLVYGDGFTPSASLPAAPQSYVRGRLR